MDTNELLSDCIPIVDAHLEYTKRQHRKYNIYRLLNVTENEVQICRILADLLDPNGEHGEGSEYLRVFFESVLQMTLSESDLRDARVYKEYLIDNDRRIDIVISYQDCFIPIEVKINAGDQKSQCYDYYQYAFKRYRDAYVVYLTRDGYMPSDYSMTGANGDKLREDRIKCVSFSTDIMNWLEILITIACDEMNPMLEQFRGAIKDFIDTEDEEYEMNLSDRIIRDSESLRTSIEISNSVNSAKSSLMVKLFEEFDRQMQPLIDKYGLETETRSEWFHYKYEATRQFYAHNESTYPGLNYVFKSVDLGEGLSLWLRIEIDNRLFGSLCVFDYNASSDTGYEVGNQCDKISPELWDKLRQRVALPEKKDKDGWIIAWKYLPTGLDSTVDGIERVPDFKKMNEAAIELADEDKRKDFVSASIKVIEDTLIALVS